MIKPGSLRLTKTVCLSVCPSVLPRIPASFAAQNMHIYPGLAVAPALRFLNPFGFTAPSV